MNDDSQDLIKSIISILHEIKDHISSERYIDAAFDLGYMDGMLYSIINENNKDCEPKSDDSACGHDHQ